MQASSKDLTGIGTKHHNIARPKNRQKKSQWIPVFDPNPGATNGTVA